jgi:hypothetical protein
LLAFAAGTIFYDDVLEQIFDSLPHYAFKFTPKDGRVAIVMTADGDEAQPRAPCVR